MAKSYSIDYVKMVPYLLKAIQEQKDEINGLAKTVNTMDDGNETMAEKFRQMEQQMKQQQQAIAILQEQAKKQKPVSHL